MRARTGRPADRPTAMRLRGLLPVAYLILALGLTPGLTHEPARATDAPLVAVAANMSDAMDAISARFEALAGVRLRLSAGASGNLARQIERGAPYELFISADDGYPRRVAEAGFARLPPVPYAEGRLDLLLPAPQGMTLDAAASDGERVRTALGDPHIRRLALANPDHAPYGLAARQVLEALGLWHAFQGRLVLGESASQAARFASTGAVQAALLPRAIAGNDVFRNATRIPVPEQLHAPIHQHMVLLNGAGPAARNLYDFMLGDEARKILTAHGYALPARD